MNPKILALCLPFFILAYQADGLSCSAFLIKKNNRTIVGKNFDWDYGHGFLMVNKKGVQKIAAIRANTDRPYLWTSKYGSLTFNQLGQELPYGGINEKGLTAEILWLQESQFPKEVPGKLSINESQWIQVILDKASSLEDVENLQSEFQVLSAYAPVHYFVCQSDGRCAVYEFLNGELAITRLPTQVGINAITNSPASESLNFLKGFVGFGGKKSIPADGSSSSRFVRLSSKIKDLTEEVGSERAGWALLDAVKNPTRTQWSILYDVTQSKILFKLRGEAKPKIINFASFDFICGPKVKALDLKTKTEGDVSSLFQDYSDSLNKALIEKNLFLPSKFFPTMEDVPRNDRCS